MDTTIEIKDYTKEILNSFGNKSISFLYEVKDLVADQASNNSPVDTGHLAQSFIDDSYVDEEEMAVHIGSSLKYAVWQEYGTGEQALNGDGRKGWTGVAPQRMLYKATLTTQPMIERRAKQILGTVSKNG